MRYLVLFIAFLFSACSPGGSQVFAPANGPFTDKRPAIIFIHGYYGSALVDPQTGVREFANPVQGLFDHLRIARHSEELGTRPSPELKVEGMWGTVVVMPFLYETPVYNPVMKLLAQNQSQQVIPYSYDWRQDSYTSVQGLDVLIKKLQAAGVPKITLMAHSMGGLIASYYLAYGAQNPEHAVLNWEGTNAVKKALFFGTPFRGAMSILRNMQHGTGYPWNPAFIEAATAASFEASYFAVPIRDGSFVSEEGAYIPLDLTQSSTWKEWHLGYYHQEAATPAIAASREKFTAKEVGATSKFFQLLKLSGKAPPVSLKIINVIGNGTRTLAKGFANFATHEVFFRKTELSKLGKDISLLEEDGDGTVPAASAELPEALSERALVLHTNRTHGELFMDPKIEKGFTQFLNEP